MYARQFRAVKLLLLFEHSQAILDELEADRFTLDIFFAYRQFRTLQNVDSFRTAVALRLTYN